MGFRADVPFFTSPPQGGLPDTAPVQEQPGHPLAPRAQIDPEKVGGGQEPVMGTAADRPSIEVLSEADTERRLDFLLDLGRGDLDVEDDE